MSSNFENFRPKLRSGRVIPQGSRIIFETDDPYNQIILPVGLADVVLLCSGKFSMREIIEKLYRKQGAVPFRSILQAMHLLHQGGFFENGSELILNTHLHSWMEPKRSRWSLSWRFGQRIVADRRSPAAYYGLTLAILVGAILGLQMFPASPFALIERWLGEQNFWNGCLRLFLCSSLVQSARHLLRGIQVLLLTGKAYNVSIRLSLWGMHLHVGDETNDLFENRLYSLMFHFSQILMGWFFIFCISPILSAESLNTMLILNAVLSFWELNPFVNSDGLKLLQALMLQRDGSIASWHFESSTLINSLDRESIERERGFSNICAIWGMIWLLTLLTALHGTAIVFGPSVLVRIMAFDQLSAAPVLALAGWMCALYYVVQSFLETIVVANLGPWYRKVQSRLRNRFIKRKPSAFAKPELLEMIQPLPLFSHFQDAFLLRILEHSEVMHFHENQRIVTQGEAANDVYVLLEGQVEILRGSNRENAWHTDLGAISVFGESALLDAGSPRKVRIKAKTYCAVLKVKVDLLRQVAEQSNVSRYLNEFCNAILVGQFFASSPVFRSLSKVSVDFLCSRGSIEYYDERQAVFAQGDPGDCVYLILRGSVDVEVHGTAVTKLNEGHFFGEIALLANVPRTATVLASEPSVFFKISTDAFWEVLLQHMDLGVFLETVSENRLKEDLKLVHPLKRTGSDSN